MESETVTKEVAESKQLAVIDKLKMKMIDRIAETDAHFRHQQRGEPDLGHEEKANIALDILNKSPAKFLERFSKFLTKDDVTYFENMKSDYVVNFYLEEISKRITKQNINIVKNRRYQAMEELMDGGEYFSQNEMKWRNPLLFEQMVGQYETIAEQDAREIDKKDLKFSSILLNHLVDADATKERYNEMKETEECQEEEEDESSDDDQDMEKSEDDEEKIEKENEEDDGEMDKDTEIEDEESKISEIEKGYLKGEFLKIMQERFMAGADTDFDYSAVDSNADYDALDILGHDAEEKYFDGEDTESRMSQDSEEAGDFCKTAQDSAGNSRIQGGENVLEIRSGLRGMGLTEKINDEDVEDYMTYEPSVELVQRSKENVYGEG